MMLDLPEKSAIKEEIIIKRQMLKASDGTEVFISGEGRNERISVRSNKGQIVFEYHPETKKCHLYVPEGDLHFAAPNGSVSVSSGRDITLQCPGNIVIEGRDNVRLTSGMNLPGNASLHLRREQAELTGTKVGIQAKQGDFSIAESRWRSQIFTAKIDRARASINSMELLTEKMCHRAKNLSQIVDDLFQINAGRMRTFVRGLFNLKGERTYIKADKDMKLKADKIHLR